jgi:tetratricopeptide (TPR) repeat protein
VATQRHSDPKRLSQLFRGELDWIVMKCLEKDRNRRYDTANSLAKDIEHYLQDEPVLACPPSVVYRLRKWLRKHRVAALTCVALALVLVLATLGLVANNLMIRSEQELTQAANERLQDNLKLSLKALDGTLQKLEVRMPRDPDAARENQEILTEALGFYENFAARNQADANVRREAATAYSRAGHLHLRLGNYEKGIAALDRAAEVSAKLIEDFPADQEAKRSLAEIHKSKGEAYLTRGELRTEDFQKGIEILEPLLATADLSSECLATLAELHNDLGLCLQRRGDFVEAENHYREALKLQASAVEKKDDLPSKLYAIEQLAGYRGNLAYLFTEANRPEKAVRELRDVITAFTQVKTQASTLPGYQRGRLPGFPSWQTFDAGLAEAYCMLARAQRTLGQSRAAEKSCEQSLKLWTQVAADWPAEHRHRWKLAIVESNFGTLVFESGRRAEAAKHYRKSIDLLVMLDKQSPNVRDNQEELGISLVRMGDFLFAEGDRKLAAEHYRRALVLMDRLVTSNPDSASDADALAWFLAICADPNFRDPARAVSLARVAVKQSPENGAFWSTLGVAQLRQGQWQAAVVSLENADRIHQGRDEGTLWFLAMAKWRLGDKERARTCYDRADQLAKVYEYPRTEEARFRDEASQLHIRSVR